MFCVTAGIYGPLAGTCWCPAEVLCGTHPGAWKPRLVVQCSLVDLPLAGVSLASVLCQPLSSDGDVASPDVLFPGTSGHAVSRKSPFCPLYGSV